MTITRNRRSAIVLAALLGLGTLAGTSAAGANPGLDDPVLTTCTDLDENGFPQCDNGDDDEPEDLPEGQPEADDGGDLPDADVDGTVVADPNFTG